MGQPKAAVDHGTTTETGLARVGIALANWSERWFPDPLVFALLGVVTVFLIGMAAGEDASTLAIQAGKNFWTLVPFTMQMVMVIVGETESRISVVSCQTGCVSAGEPRRPIQTSCEP